MQTLVSFLTYLFLFSLGDKRKMTSFNKESSRSLPSSKSPSFCSLKIKSGLLYGLRASRCTTLSLRGLSCTPPALLLCDAQASFFTLSTLALLLMLPIKDWDAGLGFARLASAGAGGRTVTFLPAREKKVTRQKKETQPKHRQMKSGDATSARSYMRKLHLSCARVVHLISSSLERFTFWLHS